MPDQPFDECCVGSVGAEVAGLQAADLIKDSGVVLQRRAQAVLNHEATLNLAHELQPGHWSRLDRREPGKACPAECPSPPAQAEAGVLGESGKGDVCWASAILARAHETAIKIRNELRR
jgi:hypothetical protein